VHNEAQKVMDVKVLNVQIDFAVKINALRAKWVYRRKLTISICCNNLNFAMNLILSILIATTYIGGYYEGEFGYFIHQNPWGRHKVETRFVGKPSEGTEAFISLFYETTNQRGRWLFWQGHLSMRKQFFEMTLFSREDRFYVPSPLLKLVNTDRLKDDSWGPKASGMRFDFWEKYGLYITGIVSKYGTWDGEAYVFKGYKKFMKDRFGLGVIYLKKDWRGSGVSFNEVSGLEGSFKVKGPLRINFEIAKSLHPNNADSSDRAAWELELRSIRFKNFLIAGSFFDYGRNFFDELSNRFNPSFDREFGRRGYYAEVVYLVPYKAINLIYKAKTYRTNYYMGMPEASEHLVRWNYFETYWEFINGFTFKASYDVMHEKHDTWRHLFFEIGGETKRAGGKIQLKIKDIGVNTRVVDVPYSIGQRVIWGVEARYNITDNLQFYGRAAVGHAICGTWQSIFLQFAYRGFKNSEIYLEFGEPSHTADGLVNDPDVADTKERRVEQKIKLFYKFWF